MNGTEWDVCAIDGCDRPRRCQNWCDMHYSRWRRNGSPHVAKTSNPKRPPALTRWRERVQESPSGCWEWTGHKYANGYGRFTEPHTRRQWLAHRWGYVQLVGTIPDDKEIDHLCRNKGCVNPDHLEPVTHPENVRRHFVAVPQATHCRNGHEYTPDSIYVNGNPPVRRCKTCSEVNRGKRVAS